MTVDEKVKVSEGTPSGGKRRTRNTDQKLTKTEDLME